MDRKEKIYKYITSPEYVPLKFNEMAVVLDVPESDMIEFSKILDSLVYEGKIYKTKRGRYCVADVKNRMISGTLMCNQNGFGFVRCDEEGEKDIFVPFEKMGKAYDRDRVFVRIDEEGTENTHRVGHISQIIERGNTNIVGVLCEKRKGVFRLKADRREFFSSVRIKENDLNGAELGDRVIAKITKYDENNKPYGKVTSLLGAAESIEGCINGIIADNELPLSFPQSVIELADSLPQSVSEKEMKDREDLRNKIIFTIDGDDSRDFDDAVSLEFTSEGNRVLGVHIADVTHYVKQGTKLDKEALKRGTSVYFPDRVIPMLPKSLSNGICSLNPDVDRLALSVFIEFDKMANVLSGRISKTVIHSCARMTYNNVNKIFDGDKELREEYKEIVPTLEAMDELALQLSEKRDERGSIDFDFPEAYVVCDGESNPVDVQLRQRGKSHKLIEAFMLAANEYVAETAFWSELPFVYRVHEAPGSEKLTAFNEFIKNFGYSLKGKLDSESIHPKDLQTIMEKVKGQPEEQMISKIMLRSLMKAGYRDTNDGHFGLAAKYYCHFTSPIRRYPDLMIHRILKEFVSGKLSEARYNFYMPVVKEAAAISSEREITAEKAEREVVEMLKAAYMKAYEGETFEGVVSSVTNFGIFVMLDNTCEGLVRYESIADDYFEYDDTKHIATGIRSGKIYSIGDNVTITVAAADPVRRRIDFVFEGDNPYTALRQIQRRERKIEKIKTKPKSNFNATRKFVKRKQKRNRR